MTQFGNSKFNPFHLAVQVSLVAASASLGACGGSTVAAYEDALSAKTLLQQGRVAEARRAINDAIAARDDEPHYHVLRGRIEMEAGSVSGAFDAYSDAISLDPSNIEALHAVSQLGLQTGHFRQSLDATDAILSLTPEEPGALLIRGLHAIIRKRFAEADGYADRILASDPSNEGGVILKARIAVRKGSPQDAIAVLSSYGDTKPNTRGVAMTRLEVYRSTRDALGMRSQFALLRNLAPDDADVRLDEANFAFKDGRPRDGIALIIGLLSDPKAEPNRALSAIRLWREYMRSGPADPDLGPIATTGTPATRLAVAEFLVDNNRLVAAGQMLAGMGANQRLALDAFIAARAGRWSAASRLADQALLKDETHCLALTVRAEVFLQQGALADAQRLAQLAASQCSGQARAWKLAANAYARRKDMDNARRIWRQGVAANSQDTGTARAYINWLAKSDQQREALSVARRLTHAAPALLSGWQLYRETCQRFDSSCLPAAKAGLDDAATLYAIDFLPGQAPPNGLFGRIVTR